MKDKPLKPLVHGGSFLPSDRYTPLVYPGGKTTLDNGGSAGKNGEEAKAASEANSVPDGTAGA